MSDPLIINVDRKITSLVAASIGTYCDRPYWQAFKKRGSRGEPWQTKAASAILSRVVLARMAWTAEDFLNAWLGPAPDWYGHSPGVSRRPAFLGQRVTKHTMVIMDSASCKSVIATSGSTRERIPM